MAQFESIVCANRSYNVFTHGVAHAMRDDLDIRSGLRGLDDLAQRDGRAARSVQLGDVVRLGDGEGIAVQFRQVSGEAEELLHANGKVGSVKQCASALTGERLHRVQVRVPAGGADNDAATAAQHSCHILDSGLGSGEVDARVDISERGGSESGSPAILVDVE